MIEMGIAEYLIVVWAVLFCFVLGVLPAWRISYRFYQNLRDRKDPA